VGTRENKKEEQLAGSGARKTSAPKKCVSNTEKSEAGPEIAEERLTVLQQMGRPGDTTDTRGEEVNETRSDRGRLDT